jgi:hypothetical protein
MLVTSQGTSASVYAFVSVYARTPPYAHGHVCIYCMNMHTHRSITRNHIHVHLPHPSVSHTRARAHTRAHTRTHAHTHTPCVFHECIPMITNTPNTHTHTHTHTPTHTHLTCSHSRRQDSKTPKALCEERCTDEDKKAAVLEVLRKAGAS